MQAAIVNHFPGAPTLKLLPYDSQTERGWHRKVMVGEEVYRVGVTRGKRVRIAYKPRGPEGWGYWWHGYVRDINGREIWSAQVNKSTGAKALLHFAGVIDDLKRVRKQVKYQPYWTMTEMCKNKVAPPRLVNTLAYEFVSDKRSL